VKVKSIAFVVLVVGAALPGILLGDKSNPKQAVETIELQPVYQPIEQELDAKDAEIRKFVEEEAVRQYLEAVYQERLKAEAVARVEAAKARAAKANQRSAAAYSGSINGIPCGGEYPPCWVLMRESRGSMTAYNRTGCSGRGCYGPYQCDPRTCDGSLESVKRVWNGGKGCSHWKAC
jgi:hypothetical protein